MALSRMYKISDLCTPKGSSLFKYSQNKFKISKNVRNFKRGRTGNEESKINPESVETPFTSSSVDAGSLHFGKLAKPFFFTVATCFFRMNLQGRLKKWWNGLTPGERIFVPICVMNVLVFAAWRIPRLQPVMMKYFCSNPASENVCLPMILSTFSHYSGFHLLANMYVLHSFSTGAVHSLGMEQFLGLYLTAGVFLVLPVTFIKLLRNNLGYLWVLTMFMLNDSGAIMAILGYVCTQYPDTRLGIILLPVFTFSAGAAIKFIVGLDTVGVLLGWKFFDHAAHLGGAACGIAWALWGHQYVWQKREPVLRYWHEFRGSIK
ncbi:hypothetical protein NQ317_009054 [Molorchus minor]|uniref:rhomboid protease n=1 Tax=Molorchus minor TaxID=1323400 RepID=A0ABQ9J1Y6_9CUCU|nr:hypothetical protein NQ317_009054 [Molorchus minor]